MHSLTRGQLPKSQKGQWICQTTFRNIKFMIIHIRDCPGKPRPSGWANTETELGKVMWGNSQRISAEHKFECASTRCKTGMQGRRVSWLTSCFKWYHDSLWCHSRFHIGHINFQPALYWCELIDYFN